MTFGELQTAVLRDGFDSVKFGTDVKRWLNDAQRRIARRVSFNTTLPTTIAIAVGASSASIMADPTQLERVHGVTFTPNGGDPVELAPVGSEAIDELSATDTGTPEVYALAGASIQFRPLADVAGSINCRVTYLPAKLVNTADVPVLHEDYHDMMVVWARAKCFRDEDDLQMHDALMAHFESEVQRLKVDMQAVNEDGPTQLGGTF